MKRTLIYMFAAMSLVGSSCSGDWLHLNPSTSVTTPQAIRTLEESANSFERHLSHCCFT